GGRRLRLVAAARATAARRRGDEQGRQQPREEQEPPAAYAHSLLPPRRGVAPRHPPTWCRAGVGPAGWGASHLLQHRLSSCPTSAIVSAPVNVQQFAMRADV